MVPNLLCLAVDRHCVRIRSLCKRPCVKLWLWIASWNQVRRPDFSILRTQSASGDGSRVNARPNEYMSFELFGHRLFNCDESLTRPAFHHQAPQIATAPSRMASPPPCVVTVSPWTFRCVWVLFLLLHAASALYFYAVIKIHLYLSAPNISPFLNYIGTNLYRFFDVVLVAAVGLCGAHLSVILSTISISLWRRELTLRRVPRAKRAPSGLGSFRQSTSRLGRCSQRLSSVASHLFTFLFGRRGPFGMESQYFDGVYLMREVVEVTFQTYQTWKLSHLVSSVGVNRAMALVMVVNCWSTPLIHTILRGSDQDSLRKFTVMFVDLLLDWSSSIVVPVVVFGRYLREFNANYDDFPLLNYYDDTWFIRAVAENQQVFVMSWLDFVTKLLPYLTVLSNVRSLKATIRKRTPVSVSPRQSKAKSIRSSFLTVTKTRRRVNHVAEISFFLWGIFVLTLHLHATTVAILHPTRGCLLETRPWLATRYNCVVLELHCEQLGHNVDHDTQLTPLAATSVRELIFSSCPRLRMPSRIQSLPNLLVLKVYNSTIAEWTADAALVQNLHPSIQFVYIIETNLSRIPDGLLSSDFPPTLSDIEFSGTNLTDLPINLHEIWGVDGFLDFFVFENVYGGLSDVPEALHSLKVRHLSLCANGLKTLPERLFWANSTIEMLDLSSNPLVTLPRRSDMMDSPSTPLWELHVEFSGIKTLPEWLHTVQSHDGGLQLVLFAGGSPLCQDVGPVEELLSSVVTLDCTLAPGATSRVLYPEEAERGWRKQSAERY